MENFIKLSVYKELAPCYTEIKFAIQRYSKGGSGCVGGVLGLHPPKTLQPGSFV